MTRQIFCGATLTLILSLMGWTYATYEWNEGFYFADEISPSRRLGIDKSVIHSTQMVSGAYAYRANKTIPTSKKSEWEQKYCSHPQTKIWFKELCLQLSQCPKRATECELSYHKHCGGTVIAPHWLVTAKHCIYDDDEDLRAKFLSLDGADVIEFQVEKTPMTQHNLPFDIALLKIIDWPRNRPTATLSSRVIRKSPVIAIGFPHVWKRDNFEADYTPPHGEMRISIGRITEANPGKKSFCLFSNDIFEAQPESWLLEDDCPKAGPFKIKNSRGIEYEARQEKNVLLTNTDMIYGMSGSGLFNRWGEFIGVGTTVLSDSPPLNYDRKKNAVYLKAENIREIIKQLQKETDE
jgi:hypothetical protein